MGLKLQSKLILKNGRGLGSGNAVMLSSDITLFANEAMPCWKYISKNTQACEQTMYCHME